MSLKANKAAFFYYYYYFFNTLLLMFVFFCTSYFSFCMQITATIVNATPASTESEPVTERQSDPAEEFLDVPETVFEEQQMVNSMCQTDPLQVCIKIYWSVLKKTCFMSLHTFWLIFLFYLVYFAR
jgi:hypothetical protein